MHCLKETSVENKSAQSKECNDVKNEGSLTSIYTMVLEISHSKVRNTSKLDVAILWVFSLFLTQNDVLPQSYKMATFILLKFQTLEWIILRTLRCIEISYGSFFLLVLCSFIYAHLIF